MFKKEAMFGANKGTNAMNMQVGGLMMLKTEGKIISLKLSTKVL